MINIGFEVQRSFFADPRGVKKCFSLFSPQMETENVDPPVLGAEPALITRSKLEMTEDGRIEALSMMLAKVEDGRFPHGEMKKLCEKFGGTRSTLWRLWKRSGSSRV